MPYQRKISHWKKLKKKKVVQSQKEGKQVLYPEER
jgi:hypothetical protein